MGPKCEQAMKKKTPSQEFIDNEIIRLTKELKELEAQRTLAGCCAEIRAFLEFMKTANIKMKFYFSRSSTLEFVCTACGHDIPDELTKSFLEGS
jgi:hypothetical protein